MFFFLRGKKKTKFAELTWTRNKSIFFFFSVEKAYFTVVLYVSVIENSKRDIPERDEKICRLDKKREDPVCQNRVFCLFD